MSETNIIAQIIANAADKALGVRPNGKPKPHDFAAAEVIESAFLLIPRDELPEVSIIDRDGKPHVDVSGSEAGTWPANGNHENNRRWGLEYLVAAEEMKKWQSKQEVLKREKRRDDIARDLVGDGAYAYRFAEDPLKKAIDRIIELEAQNEDS